MITDLIEAKKKELISIQDVVYEILEKNTDARNNDDFLYYLVCKLIPSTETVRRTRQKIQAANPWLAGNRYVRKMRQKNEQAFREYARK